jgi:hypothetical protein
MDHKKAIKNLTMVTTRARNRDTEDNNKGRLPWTIFMTTMTTAGQVLIMDHRKPSTMVQWKVDYHSSMTRPRDSRLEGLMTHRSKHPSRRIYLTVDRREDQAGYRK